jgi:TRAP-type C4-dicarboxylate transport system substrate-binding protein
MSRLKSTLAFVIIALSLAAPLAAQTITLQIGAAVPANSPWDLGLRKLAAEWSRISGGRVRLSYPRSMANASQEDLLQKMKFSLDGGMLETTGLFFIDKDFLLLSMPSIIHDEKEFAAAMGAMRPIMKARLADRYELVTVAQGGYLHFFSNRPILSPADLVNVRIGVDASQDILMKQMQAIGARTVKSDMSTTLLQFNSNALDANYSSPLIIATLWSQFKRSISHMSSFRLSPFYGALLINKRSWDRVPDEFKPALLAAADQISLEIASEALKLEREAIAMMQSQGLSVPRVSDEQMKAWNELFTGPRMQSLFSEWFSPEFTKAVTDAVQRVRN